MKHMIPAVAIGAACLLAPALASATTVDAQAGCYYDTEAERVAGHGELGAEVRFGLLPTRGVDVRYSFTVNGVTENVSTRVYGPAPVVFPIRTGLDHGTIGVSGTINYLNRTRTLDPQYFDCRPDIEEQPTPAPAPSTPEATPQPTPPPTTIEPLPPIITPRPDKPPVKRVPLRAKKQVQIVRAVACVLGTNARRSYTVRQVKVTWSRGGKIVRTKFSKRYVVRGKFCSQPAVTG